ncbi:MAG: type I restriction-modification system subunit M N-terminal domain-containing protein [Selenomonadaceae bacterium]|nr:type I restriction-modification system subunit M N-terminal domain-containing protein [Selenomonadaceae bacterium]
MANDIKEQEREEIHKRVWAIADELRGSVDGWDFKNYVLGTMFYRYMSDNLTTYINKGEHEAGNLDFDYAKLSDEEAEEAKEYFSKLASFEEIKAENYNLSVSTYVEQEDKREKIDITELNAKIKEIVAREQVLRDEIDKIVAEIEG